MVIQIIFRCALIETEKDYRILHFKISENEYNSDVSSPIDKFKPPHIGKMKNAHFAAHGLMCEQKYFCAVKLDFVKFNTLEYIMYYV